MSRLPPPRPAGAAANELQHGVLAWAVWEEQWGDADGNVQRYVSKLAPVRDVDPASVQRAGERVYMSGRPQSGYVSQGPDFDPVTYDQLIYEARAIDPKIVARVEVSDKVAATVVAAPFLSDIEKRALLVGLVPPGTPLVIGMGVRGSNIKGASLAITSGRVALTLPAEGGEDMYVDGELVSTTVAWSPPGEPLGEGEPSDFTPSTAEDREPQPPRGPSSGKDSGAKRQTETEKALEDLAALAREMCSCNDKGCTESVNTKLKKWSNEVKTAAKPSKLDSESARRADEIMRRYSACALNLRSPPQPPIPEGRAAKGGETKQAEPSTEE